MDKRDKQYDRVKEGIIMMRKLEGIHFYINISNFSDVVTEEESRCGKVNHAIHALDTFFAGIESFGKTNFPDVFVVEKLRAQDYICMY